VASSGLPAGVTSDYVSQPEGRLRVLIAGEDGSPVLLLSGAGLDNALLSWRHLIPVLAENHHRVYALDWPKQGLSRPWNGYADNQALERCVVAVMDHYGIDRSHLVGLSQGGAIALGIALNAPHRVDRLVAIAPGGIITFPPIIHQLMWLTAKLPWLTAKVSEILMSRRSMIVATAKSTLFPGSLPEDFDDIVDEIAEEARRNGVRASDWQNASIGPCKMNVYHMPELGRIQSPTLFIQGDRDVAVRPHFTREAASRVPGARLEMLSGHGHWPNRQSPALVNRLIVEFLT
jgi:pimeloyl-ACP methyl ester carboxylesterase